MAARRHLLDSSASDTGMVVAATPANSTAEAEMTQASFDSNMIIILAALLCALICALGLNSIVRCVLRCAQSAGVQTTASATGLKKSTLRKIPIIVYGSEPGSGMEPGSECPICLGEFVDGEKVRVLPKCNHGFHVRCIDTWLGSHSSCPNCRHSLVDVVSLSKVAPPQSIGGSGGGRELVVVEVNTQS
uniref:RING-type E3 ubiquitin transferase n=1 Tax=Opuntia streptacantha TaxID=393608 RepID=A0A7C9CAI2_OPUST